MARPDDMSGGLPMNAVKIFIFYSTFHFANQRSLNVNPIVSRKEFSLIVDPNSLTHCPLTLSMDRLLSEFCIGMPKPMLADSSLGPLFELNL